MATVTMMGVGAMLATKYSVFAPDLPTPVAEVIAPQPVVLTISSSVTKQRWMQAAIARFDAAGIRTASGRPIAIKVTGVLSGDLDGKKILRSVETGRLVTRRGSWVSQFEALWKSGTINRR